MESGYYWAKKSLDWGRGAVDTWIVVKFDASEGLFRWGSYDLRLTDFIEVDPGRIERQRPVDAGMTRLWRFWRAFFYVAVGSAAVVCFAALVAWHWWWGPVLCFVLFFWGVWSMLGRDDD